MIIKKCPICGDEFRARHSWNVHCSRDCGVIGRGGITRKNQIKFACKQCGGEYERKASQAGKTKFCSVRCRSLHMKTLVGSKNGNYKDGRAKIKSGLAVRGGNGAYKKGRYYEVKTRRILEEKGYYVVRSGGSKGLIDLVAVGENDTVIIQVKAGKSPFSPKERNAFIEIVVHSNCRKELWRWRDRRGYEITKY